jgi:predicted Zn-dependent protease
MDILVSCAALAVTQGQDPSDFLKEASALPVREGENLEDPVEQGAIRLRYIAVMLRAGYKPAPNGLRETAESLSRSLIPLKPVDPGFWMALGQFQDANGNPAAATQARARGRALNPRWQSF